MARNVFLVGLLVLSVLISAPLITPVAMGGVFAILFWPVLEWLEERRVPNRAAALGVTLSFSTLVLLPFTILVLFSARSALEIFRDLQAKWRVLPPLAPGEDWAEKLSHQPWVTKWLGKLSSFFPIKLNALIDTASEAIKLVGIKLGESLGDFVGKVPGMVLALVVVIASLYFFLVDGRRLALFVRRNSFFDSRPTEELLDGLVSMARSVVMATVAGGLVQTVIFLVAMLVTGFPNPGLVAFLVFAGSFVPLVGAAPVTLGSALIAWVQMGTTEAVVLFIGALVTSLADNVVRPWVLKGGANIHPLVGFMAAFGGLQFLGLSGLFLGPIVAGLSMALVRIHSRK